MPRYFFDIHDGRIDRDEDGIECADLQAAVLQAKKAVSSIAATEVPKDGERHTFTVLVTDETGQAVYLPAMTYTGTWLSR